MNAIPHDPTGWVIQEKYDGCFVRWTGTAYLSRTGLYFIRNSAFKDSAVTMKAARCLALAVRMGDFRLIADAALSQITWADPEADRKADLKAHAMILANDVHQNPSRHGFTATPPKAEILRYLKTNYPQEFKTIPKPSARRDWWKRVSLAVPQGRGW